MDHQLTDFTINLQEIELLAPKLNRGIQVIFVIHGELTIETNSRYYHLKEKDVLVINRNQLYQAKGSKQNHVLLLQISDQYMQQNYEEYSMSRFECFSGEVDLGRESVINRIRRLVAELMITFFRRDLGYRIEIQSYISDILLILIRRFKQEGTIQEKVETGDRRLMQIIDYMERNYQQTLTLDDVAKKFYLSPSYFSRYFKNKVGIGFNRYLMKVRLEHAMKDLLYTPDSISNIAMNNGFPNVKSFVQYFKEVYKQTPKLYREANQEISIDYTKTYDLQDAAHIIQSSDVLEEIGGLLTDTDEGYSNTETQYTELNLDIRKAAVSKLHRPKHNLAIGELSELLKEGVRRQILMAKKELRLEYIGVRKLIGGSTFMPPVETDEIIATTSPYYNADFALNFLRKYHLSLFIRVDYKEVSNDEVNFFNGMDDFIKHCLNVYGIPFVEKWYVMFYESSTTVSGSELERIYTKLYQSLKKRVPSIKVGAFLPFSFKDGKTDKNHTWLVEKNLPIDFFGYEANQNEIIDFEELGDDRISIAEGYIKEKTVKVKAYLKKHAKNQHVSLVSWNTLSGNTRHTNGTFFRGALILQNALEIADEVDSLGFWINTEQHEKSVRDRKIRMEGLELYHYFNGKRPAYFAMQFLERLNGSIICQDREYVMTKNERGYQLILMNINNVNPYFTVEETFLKKLNKEVRVTISGLQNGEYQIRKRVFDKDYGALYTKWWELNSKYGMDEEVIHYINETSKPSLELFDEKIEGDWSFYSYMTLNAIHFFDIRRAFH
ncbi:helix-turn-helix domain-containing protein [Oceanobacillus piezotolerans]|uniref:Helix-turn-helix domain-containing protein n=1 Tax=Oceanobacillus piezotolerans TaxID=2448030 RepID=A0A498DE05_9BACI|nr:helix-turn-helix domain-containing protein [Oceanobacillus piezotolerans]RLL41315.1 helix-turn-helix domain-containing protein [Oceanobacillus piezotolerans]